MIATQLTAIYVTFSNEWHWHQNTIVPKPIKLPTIALVIETAFLKTREHIQVDPANNTASIPYNNKLGISIKNIRINNTAAHRFAHMIAAKNAPANSNKMAINNACRKFMDCETHAGTHDIREIICANSPRHK